MKRLWMLMLCVMFSGLAFADGAYAVRKRMEASMVVTGSIVVAPDGSVRSYELDKPDQLPPAVVGLMRKATAEWRFGPVLRDGVAVAAKAKMSTRIVAKRQENGDYVARVAGTTFGEDLPEEQVSIKKDQARPRYPMEAVRARVAGTVYLLLRIDRDGKVADVSAEQVNLTVADDDNGMRVWRRVLADASIRAAREWTFNTPTSGPRVKDDYWIARVPVSYQVQAAGTRVPDDYGHWQGYIPGPKEPVPWLAKYRRPGDDEDNMADALPDDGLYMLGSGPHLITPPDHS
ncbi:energy transducer TonB [Dyella subtropica]|uniref:energy transducer TonB n=1 Tax=Dyella subtropica TaxID=2992127 RepID=UPI0022541D6D|nr:energy transducer TonB [Dyella subtropica]